FDRLGIRTTRKNVVVSTVRQRIAFVSAVPVILIWIGSENLVAPFIQNNNFIVGESTCFNARNDKKVILAIVIWGDYRRNNALIRNIMKSQRHACFDGKQSATVVVKFIREKILGRLIAVRRIDSTAVFQSSKRAVLRRRHNGNFERL